MGGSLCSPDRGLTGPDVAVGSSVPSVDLDLTGLGQHVNDVGFEVGVVHARLPELARIPVVLPVVVPVASAVSPEPIHVHLWEGGAGVTGRRGPWREWGGGGDTQARPKDTDSEGTAASSFSFIFCFSDLKRLLPLLLHSWDYRCQP